MLQKKVRLTVNLKEILSENGQTLIVHKEGLLTFPSNATIDITNIVNEEKCELVVSF